MTTEQQLDKAMNLLIRALAANWIPPDITWWNEYFFLTGEHTFPACCPYKTAYGDRQLVNTKMARPGPLQERWEQALNLLALAISYDAVPPEDDWDLEFFSLTGAHMPIKSGQGSWKIKEESQA